MSAFEGSKKVILFVIGVPLLLMFLGFWQNYRAYQPAEVRADITEANALIEEINARQAVEGQKLMLELNNGKKVSAISLKKDLQASVKDLQTILLIAIASTWASWVTCLGATVAFVVGGTGVWYIRSLGRKALESRDKLLESFQSGKKMLPWLLCLFSAPLILGIFAGIVFEMIMFLTYGFSGSGVGRFYIIVAMLAAGILWLGAKVLWNVYKSSRAAFDLSEITVMGREISEKSAPALWDFVKDVSAKTQTVMPDSIVVGLDEGFFVTEHPVRLYKSDHIPSGRVLYLPLPYMAFMAKAETATIIAHELGHFTGADTEYSRHFSPIYSAAIANLSAVHHSGHDEGGVGEWVSIPIIMLGEYFLDSFHEAVQFWSRKRELAADMVGATAADAQTFAAALLRVVALSPHVANALEKIWNQGGKGRPDVIEMVKESIKEQGFDNIKESLEKDFPHPTDSHPTVSQRLEAHNISIDDYLLQQATCVEESVLLVELGMSEAADAGPSSSQAEQSISKQDVTSGSTATSIAKILENDFAVKAAHDLQELRENLLQYAHDGEDTITAYSNPRFAKMFCYLLAVLLLVFAILAENASLFMKAGVGAAGIAMIFLGLLVSKQGKRPLATLSAEGIAFGDMPEPVLWHQVADIEITESSYNGISTYIINFMLEDGISVPTFSKNRRIKYIKKKNILRLVIQSLVKMKVNDFLESLFAHWRGGSARHQLAVMDQEEQSTMQ